MGLSLVGSSRFRLFALALLTFLVLFVPAQALAATTFTFETSNASGGAAQWMKTFDAPSMAVADFDGDGWLELVGVNDNLFVYVLSTRESRVLAEFKPDYPSNWNVRPINDPVVADVDRDGRLEIVSVTSAGSVCVHEYNPTTSTSTKFQFDKQWCRRMDTYDLNETAADGGAAVADVDGDGYLEIFAQTEGKGQFAFNWDGSTRWSQGKWGGNAGPLVVDLDGDGWKEAIFMSDGGTITAANASTGAQKWGFWAGAFVQPASVTVSGTAGDLDGDGKLETVFFARHATFCCTVSDFQKNHFMMFVLDHNGKLKWRAQPDWGNPLSYGHPILHDVTGDGKKEIIAMDWNTIGHKPGNWEKLGLAHVFAYKWDGTFLWKTDVDDSWSNDDVALADIDGDGALEVMALGAGPGGDGVWYLDAATGVPEQHVRVGSWTAVRGPTVADFDNDGKIDWAVPVDHPTNGGAVRFYRTDAPCVIAYGGWEIHDPCRTAAPLPPLPPPSPTSTPFQATFSTRGGNQWWVEVSVSGSKVVASVDVRVNNSTWQPLAQREWGAWAASYPIPDGSTIDFLATATSGQTNQSGVYLWPNGTMVGAPPVAPPPPPPPPPPAPTQLNATFATKGGNAWWIETRVTGNLPIDRVEANLNGGAWRNLNATSWGSWAASFAVPGGSIVTFRATSSTENFTNTSIAYLWPSGAPYTAAPANFTANFTGVRGNVWWIETNVNPNAPLAGVDVRLNGSAWQPLELKPWGSWARSLNAPVGTTVEFRARGAEAGEALSPTYLWPP